MLKFGFYIIPLTIFLNDILLCHNINAETVPIYIFIWTRDGWYYFHFCSFVFATILWSSFSVDGNYGTHREQQCWSNAYMVYFYIWSWVGYYTHIKHIIFLSAPCYFDTSGLYTFLEKNPDIGTSTSGQPDFECFPNNIPTCPQYIGKTFKSLQICCPDVLWTCRDVVGKTSKRIPAYCPDVWWTCRDIVGKTFKIRLSRCAGPDVGIFFQKCIESRCIEITWCRQKNNMFSRQNPYFFAAWDTYKYVPDLNYKVHTPFAPVDTPLTPAVTSLANSFAS